MRKGRGAAPKRAPHPTRVPDPFRGSRRRNPLRHQEKLRPQPGRERAGSLVPRRPSGSPRRKPRPPRRPRRASGAARPHAVAPPHETPAPPVAARSDRRHAAPSRPRSDGRTMPPAGGRTIGHHWLWGIRSVGAAPLPPAPATRVEKGHPTDPAPGTRPPELFRRVHRRPAPVGRRWLRQRRGDARAVQGGNGRPEFAPLAEPMVPDRQGAVGSDDHCRPRPTSS